MKSNAPRSRQPGFGAGIAAPQGTIGTVRCEFLLVRSEFVIIRSERSRGYRRAFRDAVTDQAVIITTLSLAYTVRDELLSETDAHGKTASFGYDRMNRLTTERHTRLGIPLADLFRGYDDASNLLFVQDAVSLNTALFDEYDSLNRLKRARWAVNAGIFQSLSFDYDASSNRTRLAHAGSGADLLYAWDDNNRLASVSRDGLAASFSYDTAGRRRSVTLGATARIDYSYDSKERLTSLKTSAGGSVRSHFAYTYDPRDNRSRVDLLHIGASISYGYDGLNRLTSEDWAALNLLPPGSPTSGVPFCNNLFSSVDGGNESAPSNTASASPQPAPAELLATYSGEYRYDPAGNRIEKRVNGLITSYAYDSQNRLLSESTSGRLPVAYAYDAHGNQLSRTQGSTVESFAYDYMNRMRSYVRELSGVPESSFAYAYMPTGERLSKKNRSTDLTDWFAYDGPDVLQEFEQSGSGPLVPKATYLQALSIDSKLARLGLNPDGSVAATSWYVPDALGSVHQVLDDAGLTANMDLTTAWGEPLPTSTFAFPNSVPNRHTFAQRSVDSESGLMDFRARSYDPRTGRFIQIDPMRGNRPFEHYLYGRNNPMRFKDPMGLDPQDLSLEEALDLILGGAPLYPTVKRIGFRGTEAADILTSIGASPASGAGVLADPFHRGAAEELYPLISAAYRYEAYAMRTNEGTARFALFERLSGGGALRGVTMMYDLLAGANPIHFAAETGVVIGSGQNLVGQQRSRLGAAAGFMTYLVGVKALGLIESRLAAWVKTGAVSGTEGTLVNARFAQTGYHETFSKGGIDFLKKMTGQEFRTIDQLASAIRSGAVDLSNVPVHYIVRGGNSLILNTRTATALERAGIPRAQWRGVNVSADEQFEFLLTGQLTRNKLTAEGFEKPTSLGR